MEVGRVRFSAGAGGVAGVCMAMPEASTVAIPFAIAPTVAGRMLRTPTSSPTLGETGRPKHVVARAGLEDCAAIEHDQLLGERVRLGEVVRHQHGGNGHAGLQFEELLGERGARRRVEGGERLVEQEELRVRRQRTSKRDALALSAG